MWGKCRIKLDIIIIILLFLQWNLLHLRRSLEPQRALSDALRRVSDNSCTRSFCREPRAGATGYTNFLYRSVWARLMNRLHNWCIFMYVVYRLYLNLVFFSSSAWGLVAGHSVSRGAHPLSAECEFWGTCSLPGALLASTWGHTAGEVQHKFVAQPPVLGPYPHVCDHLCKQRNIRCSKWF